MLQMKLYFLLITLWSLLLSINEPREKKEAVKGGVVSINPNRPLNWNDFKKVNLIGNRSTINAITQSTCEIEIVKINDQGDHVSLDIEVKINLHKELSQVKNDFFKTRDAATKERVLHHENGHYLIAQIIGHRILKAVNNYKFDKKNHRTQLNKIIKENFKDWKRLDEQYDAQSTKPHNPEMQARWDRFIASELQALKQD
ncbi:hypothetical protein GCM10027284_38570 [Cyclobacterium sediminis]